MVQRVDIVSGSRRFKPCQGRTKKLGSTLNRIIYDTHILVLSLLMCIPTILHEALYFYLFL